MQFKRMTALILAVLMLLSLFTGCKSNVNGEEEAVTDTVVEGEKYEATGTGPQKVDGNTNTDNTQQGTDDTQQGTDDTQQGTDDTQQGTDDTQQGTDDTQQGTDDTQQGGDDTDDDDVKVEVQYDAANHLKVIDYNIRCNDDGLNSTTGSSNDIEDRAPRLFALLEKYDPDLIGFQEAVPEWIEYIEKGIGGHDALVNKYEMRYVYRAATSKECTPILWKRDKFELIDEGTYWLSETPDVESVYNNSKYYRIATWAKLKIKATGKEFIFISTHLSGDSHGVFSAPLIAKRAKDQGGFVNCPVICVGDYNFAPWGTGYCAFIDAGFKDLNDELGFNTAYTNNGYNAREDNHEDNWIKDYITYAGEDDMIAPLVYKVLNENYYDGWISDHRGLYGEFAIL